jgi:predicted lipoprotein with Yx(FWY)xxD motif
VRRALAAVVLALVVVAAAAARDTAGSSSVAVHASKYGRILFDGRGFVLYAFSADGRRSRCSGACAAAWPPFVVSRVPHAGAGAHGAVHGVSRRRDGRLQATYAGRPLYYYVGDRKPGQILCQGVSEYGGLWQVVRANGNPVR